MRCSVVLCSYNGAKYLQAQLQSILDQSRLPDEVILSDDGSTDVSVEILECFAQRARSAGISVDVHSRNKPMGANANFELACKCASGDVIFLADQDDMWCPEKISTMLPIFDEANVLLVNSDGSIIQQDGELAGETIFGRLKLTPYEKKALRHGDLSIVGSSRNLFTGATTAFRRVLLDSALPFPARPQHDDWLAEIAWLTGEVRTIFDPLIRYRLHTNNQVGLPERAGHREGTASVRLRSYLARQITRLTPVVHRAQTTSCHVQRLALRQKQLDFAHQRLGYKENFLVRLGQVSRAVLKGRYRSGYQPARTAVLDLFRHAGGFTHNP